MDLTAILVTCLLILDVYVYKHNTRKYDKLIKGLRKDVNDLKELIIQNKEKT